MEGDWRAIQCELQMDADTRRLKLAVHGFTANGAKFKKTL